jgi:IS605 OrfB family transposase
MSEEMTIVERHFNNGNPEIIRLCRLSKELYNRCNYLMRQAWFNQQHLKSRKLPDIGTLIAETKDLECFKQFGNTKTAKQTIKKVLTDWSNFKKALKAYGKDRSKFLRCPKPPNYKKQMAQTIFYKETIQGGQSQKPITSLTANNGCFSVPFREGYKQVVITPKTFGFMIEVSYEIKEEKKSKTKLNKDKLCTIDVGLNNLCAITLDQNRPILVNGRIVKSINQWYNKRPCKSRLRKRYFRLENYFHHVSKMIVSLCLKEGIGTIVIGKNNGWKQNINLGKKTNQAFCHVPTYLLLEKIRYKALLEGVDVVFTEESYTSKSSFYDRDELPEYDPNREDEPKFSGKRKHRGLYIGGDGFAVNADVNGSLNIGRKVFPEFFGIRDRSLAARPVVINPLSVFTQSYKENQLVKN